MMLEATADVELEEALEKSTPEAIVDLVLPTDWSETYRPVGWRGRMTYDQVLALAGEAAAKLKRGEQLNERDIAALTNEEALRDCYTTRAWVWSLAAHLAEVKGFDCDPFANPWAQGLARGATVKLDGHAGRDGLACTPDRKPRYWRGSAAVNGPHSCVPRWIDLCAVHGEDHVVAAVCPSDGTRWYQEVGLTCDIEVLLGRLNYDAPPGLITREGSPRGSSLLIWAPHLRDENGSTFRPTHINVDIGRASGKKKIMLARPGLGCAGRRPPMVEM